MLDLYFWPTGNGKKITIMLEECALPYRLIPVNIKKGDQFTPEYEAISPNNKMPAIVDADTADGEPIVIFESGAILQYLAERTGKLLPRETRARIALQWVYWQIGGWAHGRRAHSSATRPRRSSFDAPLREVARLPKVLDAPAARLIAATTRSPTSPRGRGWHAGSGRSRTSTTSRRSAAGSTRSPLVRLCSVALPRVRTGPT
jgi:glutathione S-transferase